MNKEQRLWFVLVVISLIIGIGAFMIIPVWRQLGLDLQNIYAFQTCSSNDANPYWVTGFECGDWLKRDFFYPPLMYWMFSWMHFLSFKAVYAIWIGITILGVLSSLILLPTVVVPEISRWNILVVIALFLLQYPFLFALERGNNDVVVLFLWTLSLLSFYKNKYNYSSILASICIAFKIYPIIAVSTVMFGMVYNAYFNRDQRSRLYSIIAYGAMTIFVISVSTLELTWDYFFTVRELSDPKALGHGITHGTTFWTRYDFQSGFCSYCHSLTFQRFGWISTSAKVALLVIWCIVACKKLNTTPWLVFSGALAISTYFGDYSIDYSLITVYPLLLCLILDGFRVNQQLKVSRLMALIGIVTFFWTKAFYSLFPFGYVSNVTNIGLAEIEKYTYAACVYGQWAWLCAVGLVVLFEKKFANLAGIMSRKQGSSDY